MISLKKETKYSHKTLRLLFKITKYGQKIQVNINTLNVVITKTPPNIVIKRCDCFLKLLNIVIKFKLILTHY